MRQHRNIRLRRTISASSCINATGSTKRSRSSAIGRRPPQEPEFHNNLGLALAAADRYDDAVAAFRRALAVKPDHATACNNLGLVLNAELRLSEAVAAFREAIVHNPTSLKRTGIYRSRC